MYGITTKLHNGSRNLSQWVTSQCCKLSREYAVPRGRRIANECATSVCLPLVHFQLLISLIIISTQSAHHHSIPNVIRRESIVSLWIRGNIDAQAICLLHLQFAGREREHVPVYQMSSVRFIERNADQPNALKPNDKLWINIFSISHLLVDSFNAASSHLLHLPESHRKTFIYLSIFRFCSFYHSTNKVYIVVASTKLDTNYNLHEIHFKRGVSPSAKPVEQVLSNLSIHLPSPALCVRVCETEWSHHFHPYLRGTHVDA